MTPPLVNVDPADDQDHLAKLSKLPDEMGVWQDDDSVIWLPRHHYPKRIDAIRWAMDQWACHFLDVRCLSRFMQYTPHVQPTVTYDNGATTYPGWSEDRWTECDKDEPAAFAVWRLEDA